MPDELELIAATEADIGLGNPDPEAQDHFLAVLDEVFAGADGDASSDDGWHRLELSGPAPRVADVLLLAGDLTRVGIREEAEVVAAELENTGVPVVAVLGNHDYHDDQEHEVRSVLEAKGITVPQGESTVLDHPGGRRGVAGVKGFGGGFPPASASDFGEPVMKAFVRHAREEAASLESALDELDTPIKIALTHYSPSVETLEGEPVSIHLFLGSSALGEAIDTAAASLAIHGHAHKGTSNGTTAGGTPVKNVAQAVIQTSYCIVELDATAATHVQDRASA